MILVMTEASAPAYPDAAAAERLARSAAELTAVAERLAETHLDETVEPAHFATTLQALADPEPSPCPPRSISA